jgi:hypothetical protein
MGTKQSKEPRTQLRTKPRYPKRHNNQIFNKDLEISASSSSYGATFNEERGGNLIATKAAPPPNLPTRLRQVRGPTLKT